MPFPDTITGDDWKRDLAAARAAPNIAYQQIKAQAWLKEHNLHLCRMPKQFTERPWTCAKQLHLMTTFQPNDYGTGNTPEEAWADYAGKHGLVFTTG